MLRAINRKDRLLVSNIETNFETNRSCDTDIRYKENI